VFATKAQVFSILKAESSFSFRGVKVEDLLCFSTCKLLQESSARDHALELVYQLLVERTDRVSAQLHEQARDGVGCDASEQY
jgi:hypothetical protein